MGVRHGGLTMSSGHSRTTPHSGVIGALKCVAVCESRIAIFRKIPLDPISQIADYRLGGGQSKTRDRLATLDLRRRVRVWRALC